MPTLNDFCVLIHPGLNGADADHWQTHREQAFPDFVRVEQADWDHPVYTVWAAKLTEYVNRAPKPVVLVPHSAGTSLVMKWSFEEPEAVKKVAGVFFVAPSDRDRWKSPAGSGPQGFGGMILKRLPCPSAAVAGRDDDRVSFERAQEFARAWGSLFFDGGMHGHLGSAARLGVWPAGLVCFGQFLATLYARAWAANPRFSASQDPVRPTAPQQTDGDRKLALANILARAKFRSFEVLSETFAAR